MIIIPKIQKQPNTKEIKMKLYIANILVTTKHQIFQNSQKLQQYIPKVKQKKTKIVLILIKENFQKMKIKL